MAVAAADLADREEERVPLRLVEVLSMAKP
jgi:hypothetical protein